MKNTRDVSLKAGIYYVNKKLKIFFLILFTFMTCLSFLCLRHYNSYSFTAIINTLRGDPLIPNKYAINIGKICKDEKRTCEFQITNMSAKPIALFGVRTSCACTTVTALPEMINPRESVSIKIKVQSQSKGGPFTRHIRLFTNSSDQPFLILRVRGVEIRQNSH